MPDRIGRPSRALAPLAAAIVLPSLIFVLLQTGISERSERAKVEQATLDRARAIVSEVDVRIEGVEGALQTISTFRSLRADDWAETYAHCREMLSLFKFWRSIALYDLASSTELFDLRRPFGQTLPVSRARLEQIATLSGPRLWFTGIIRPPGRPPEVDAFLVVPGRNGKRLLLKVVLDPWLLQQLMLQHAPPDGVTAVVDRRGLFIARSRAYRERLATPASIYVRNAIKHGDSGLYRGVTYEGWQNYTAFATSRRTGWSAHVAVSSALIDSSQAAWRTSTVLAALASLLLGALFGWFALRSLAARRQVEARLQQAERIEAVGKLTGGIAHDFNNMLSIVIGSLDLAQRRLASGRDDVGRYVDSAMEGARRAANLTSRLLAFSRHQKLAPAVLDVNRLINDLVELLPRTLDASIRIERDLQSDLWPVFADAGQLENAILNLAVNARDAMPDGGTLRLKTHNIHASQRLRRKGDRRLSSDHVGIAVADTGTGMSKAVVARAFEPFYTTKDVGQGTGLGLSQVHGFVTQSGGFAEIESSPGHGTTITLHLPRCFGAPAGLRAPAANVRKEARRNRNIAVLLVDDDADVLRTTADALLELGCTVHALQDGAGAIDLLKRVPDIKLLMTDLVMPATSGRELARQAREQRPDIKILYLTGYDRDALQVEAEPLLHKPFSVDELDARLAALDL